MRYTADFQHRPSNHHVQPMLKVRLPFRLLGAVPLVLLAGGCSDLSGPAATTRAPAPSISASYLDIEEPQSLGSPQEVPANAGLGVPGWEQASNIGSLPDSAWIVIEVRGTVLHTKHPWCDQLFSASGGCNYTLDGVRLGPLERHGGSGVIVTLESPGVVPHPFFSSGYYQYAPDGNVHGDVARTVVRNTTGAKVLWFRRLDATPKPGNATTGLYGPMYYMSSDQKVTARVIPSPLRVDAPASVPPGEVATFSVSPTADFKFQMPDARRHFVYWRYFPGDTAARPNPFGPRQDVPCDGVACRWEPPTSGRMWAFTYVDGFGVEAASQVVRVDSVRLEVECGTQRGTTVQITLQRGRVFDCTAVVTPRQAFTIVGWTFRNDAVQIPAANAPPFTGTRWTGVMVTSGVASVRAAVGRDTLDASVTVTVEARPWVDSIGPPVIKYFRCPEDNLTAECPLPDPPVYFQDLGRMDVGAQRWPKEHRRVDNGPNAGYGYFSESASFINIREPWVEINGILTDPRHPFWRTRPECDVRRLHDEVVAHEMVHYNLTKQAVEAQFTRGWLESFTPYGTAEEIVEAMRVILHDYTVALRNSGDNDHTNLELFLPHHCDPNLRPEKRNPPVPGRPAY